MNDSISSVSELVPYVGTYVEADTKNGAIKGLLESVDIPTGQFVVQEQFEGGRLRIATVHFSNLTRIRLKDIEGKHPPS